MKLRQTLLTGTILVGAGAYKTYKDYQEAPKEQKNRILIRNTAALGGAALAVFSADKFLSKSFNSETLQGFSHKISSIILNNKIVKKFKKKFFPKQNLQPVRLKALADTISNCTKDVILTAAAGLTGILAGLSVDKILYRKKVKEDIEKIAQEKQHLSARPFLPKSVSKIFENPMVSKVANDRTRNILMNTTKVFEAAGFIQNPLEKPSLVLSSLEMAKEKSLQKIVEQTASGIVAEALIPTLFISLANSMTKNKSFFIKIPAIATGFFAGDFLGNKVGNIMTHEIRDEFFDNEDKISDDTDTK